MNKKVNHEVREVAQGYRDALIDHVWFWEKPQETSSSRITAPSLYI
jgi:hypothetical protein